MMLILAELVQLISLAATFVFVIEGCQLSAQEQVHPEFLPGLLLGFGGGFCRDILLGLVTARQVIPAFFSSYMGWLVATAGIIWYTWLKRTEKHHILQHGFLKWAGIVLDAAGLGNFGVAGIFRAREYGIENPLLLMVFGPITALGGGLIALALFRQNKKQVFLSNLSYYLIVIIPSVLVAANLSAVRRLAVPVSLLTSAVCATMGTVRALYLYTHEIFKRQLLQVGRGPKPMRGLWFWYSPGTQFWEIVNPMKGIRQWISIPKETGERTGYWLIVSV